MKRWIRNLVKTDHGSRAALACRPASERLDDRCVPDANVLQTNLVSDLPGVAANLDPHLVNPWGISESGSSPFWVSDNGANVATLYNTAGAPQSLVVSIPSPGDLLGASGTPTGTVFNIDGGPTGGFVLKGFAADGTTPASASAPRPLPEAGRGERQVFLPSPLRGGARGRGFAMASRRRRASPSFLAAQQLGLRSTGARA